MIASETLSKALNQIITKSEKVVINQEELDNSLLFEINNILHQFLTLFSEYHKLIPCKSETKEHSLNLQIHLLSTIRMIKKAYESNDLIMLNDLLCNELRDNLLQWKINIIPQLTNPSS